MSAARIEGTGRVYDGIARWSAGRGDALRYALAEEDPQT
jgi:hypothetical protein